LVYISTSGVYGDCGGAWVDEDRPLAPQNLRAVRRVEAER
jgi:nucleoside-diphosphate-sugar epimerase